MIITVVCDVLGEENNGTTVAAMNLIRSLKSKGHTVRVLCADSSRKGEEGFFVVPALNLGPFNGYVAKVGVTLAKPDQIIIEQALEGAEIVHCILPFLLGMKSMKLAKGRGIPVTAGFHCQAENITAHLGLNRWGWLSTLVYRFMYKHFYRYADGIHYPSVFIRTVFETSVGHTTPGYVISNGVNPYVEKRDVKKPKEYEDEILILSTGRYSREKAQDVLLRAVRYSAYKDRIRVVLAGQGTLEPYYRALGRKLPKKPVFRFFTREEIVNIINCCDLYVHPAEIELEGIACLEAISCGKLTIVSDSPLSATEGFAVSRDCVFRHRQPKDLARVMDRWISNPERKIRYEEKYLKSGKVFHLDYCMDRMEEMLTEVIAGAGKTRENSLLQ